MDIEYSAAEVRRAWSIVLQFLIGCALIGGGVVLLAQLVLWEPEGDTDGKSRARG